MMTTYWVIEFFASFIEIMSMFRFCSLVNKKKISIITMFFSAILVSIATITLNSISLASYFITLLLMAVYYISLLLIYNKPKVKLLLMVVLFTVLVFIIDFMFLMLFSLINRFSRAEFANNFSPQRIAVTLSSKVILIIIVEMLCKISPKSYYSNNKANIFLTLSTIGITIIASILYYTQLIKKENNTDYLILFFFILMLGMVITIYLTTAYIIRIGERKSEMLLMEQQHQLLNKYISEQEEIFLSWKEIIHNHKHKMIALNQMLSEEKYFEAKMYIEDEIELFKNKAFYIYTGNNIIDVLLSNKMNYAKRCGINFTTNIAVTNNMKLTDIQLSVILGNLLDNAFEAVMNESKKKVYLQISITEQLLIIKVVNSYTKSELTLKTKKDKKYHGIGIKSIKNIISDYDGEFTIVQKDDSVIATVIV